MDSGPTIAVRSPATGAVLGHVPDADAAAVQAAVARARQAQPRWAALGIAGRRKALRKVAARLARDEALVKLIADETGQPPHEAECIEVLYTCELIRHLTGRAARRALREELRSPFFFANKRSRLVKHPRGVVGVIGPWNWPLLNNFADCVAPLMAGNAVVLKPSPLTPLTSLHVKRVWDDLGLPAAAFTVVTGNASAGEALVQAADMIFFTGSVAAGRKIAAAAGERLIPAIVELGGKSAAIVTANADLADAAGAIVWSAFMHSGQACIRTERVIVEAAVAAQLTDLIKQQVQRLRVGSPETDADVGAIIFEPQLARFEQQIAQAVGAGAQLLAGGTTVRGPGRFFSPTLLGSVTPAMQVATEETFGPVLPIITVQDVAEAVALANALPYGLSGAVFAGSTSEGRAIARQLQTGNVCVNDSAVHYFCVESPLGGVKNSGLGARHGHEAVANFTWTETIVEDRPCLGPVTRLLMKQLRFPYQPRVRKALRAVMRLLYR
ncbi:MAG: aldehyde dehydrogenase family protein [Deltaproteobacteria bacterium]|nr:aldehyde dehydrogenase family protein [Deltaproteobacteria bacterium]